MNTIVHEGQKYTAKNIPGHGMCFVPDKNVFWDDIKNELIAAPSCLIEINKKYIFKDIGFQLRLISNSVGYSFIIHDGYACDGQIRSGFETFMPLNEFITYCNSLKDFEIKLR